MRKNNTCIAGEKKCYSFDSSRFTEMRWVRCYFSFLVVCCCVSFCFFLSPNQNFSVFFLISTWRYIFCFKFEDAGNQESPSLRTCAFSLPFLSPGNRTIAVKLLFRSLNQLRLRLFVWSTSHLFWKQRATEFKQEIVVIQMKVFLRSKSLTL